LGPPVIEWDTLSTGLAPGVAFTREPASLKLSAGVNLWAIDNRAYNYAAGSGRLWTFCDCLSPGPQYKPPLPPSREVPFTAPLPVSPRSDNTVPALIAENKSKTAGSPNLLEAVPGNKSPEPSKPLAPLSPGSSDNNSATQAGFPAADIYLGIYAVSGLLAGILITILVTSIISKNRR
jgi:hypothetical protein